MQIKNWQLAQSAPAEFEDPGSLSTESFKYTASAPGTVAEALSQHTDSLSLTALDTSDWIYRSEFSLDAEDQEQLRYLHFDGLAGRVEIWLNNEKVGQSANMFLAQQLDVAGKLKSQNSLVLIFRSAQAFLRGRRPRPNWKTNLVENQNLRWLRVSLLGYIPAWTPDIKPLGPWRQVGLQSQLDTLVSRIRLQATVDSTNTVDSNIKGQINLSGALDIQSGQRPELPLLVLKIGGQEYPLELEYTGGSVHIKQNIALHNVALWWPHTHGEANLYAWEIHAPGAANPVLKKGSIGFRQVSVEREKGNLQFCINGEAVFCRGSCWTISDIVSLRGEKSTLEKALLLLRSANMNMLRIGGTMVYESDEFYSLCDELGILVWQDFMFANMDYPIEDAEFLENIQAEATYQLARLGEHSCMTVWCGNSEVEQQSAMMGMPKENWRNAFFGQILPDLCESVTPGIPYFPSSPCEGALPFFSSSGLAHYFGVGAYKRDLNDLPLSDVKFTSECLGFSNVPAEASVVKAFGLAAPPTHLPAWKSGVPRDNSSGWDFEDIRDHYTDKLFAVDAIALRYENLEKYHQLARITSGHLMAQSFMHWRSGESNCAGALSWFYKDIVAGAGWGLLDVEGHAKPALNIVQEVLHTHQATILNKGLEGHRVGVINESSAAQQYLIKIVMLRSAQSWQTHECQWKVPAKSEKSCYLAEILGNFADSTHSYRFGGEQYTAVAVQVFDESNTLLSQAIDFPGVIPAGAALAEDDLELQTEWIVDVRKPREATLKLKSSAHLVYTAIELKGLQAQSNFLQILPETWYELTYRGEEDIGDKVRGNVTALNLSSDIRLVLTTVSEQ